MRSNMGEERRLKVSFNRPGGSASKGAISARIALPKTWLDTMGITQDYRTVVASFNGEQIEIRSVADEEHLETDSP